MIWYASLLTIRTDSGHFNYTSFVAGKCSLTQLCVDSRHKRRTNRRRMDRQIAIRNGPLNGGRLNGETPSFPRSWYESSLRHINYGVRIVRTPSRRPFASPLYRGPLWIAICLSVALSVRPSIHLTSVVDSRAKGHGMPLKAALVIRDLRTSFRVKTTEARAKTHRNS